MCTVEVVSSGMATCCSCAYVSLEKAEYCVVNLSNHGLCTIRLKLASGRLRRVYCAGLSCAVLCYGEVRSGVVWCGVVWCGVLCYGEVWCGVVWCEVWCIRGLDVSLALM